MDLSNNQSLWDLIDDAREEQIPLTTIWQSLDRTLTPLPLEQQLRVAAEAIARLATHLDTRAEQLLEDWEATHNPTEATISNDLFAGLVRSSMELDLSDLKTPPEPKQEKLKTAGRRQKPSGSVAAEVGKDQLLAVLDQKAVREQLTTLAGEEEISRWQSAIDSYLHQCPPPISMVTLQQALGLAAIELWLGLLLSGYTLEQRGDFYSSDVWIINTPNPLR